MVDLQSALRNFFNECAGRFITRLFTVFLICLIVLLAPWLCPLMRRFFLIQPLHKIQIFYETVKRRFRDFFGPNRVSVYLTFL